MECEIVKCETTEYESELTPTPVESDLVQVYDSIDQITNPNSNHVYVVGNDIYVFDGTRFLHTNDCNIPPYVGEYTVTAPSYGDLVLPTKDMLMTDDLTIEANYEIEDALIQNTALDEYVNDRVTEITSYGMYGNKIKKLTMRNLETIRARGFMDSSLLTEANFPKLNLLQNEAFRDCPSLKSIDLGALSSTANLALQTFANDTSLEVLIIRKTSVIAPTVNTFQGSSFAPGGAGGDVYVPQSVLSNYQNSQSWVDYASANITFHAIEGSVYELEE